MRAEFEKSNPPRDFYMTTQDVKNMRNALANSTWRRAGNEATQVEQLLQELGDSVFLYQAQETVGEGEARKVRAWLARVLWLRIAAAASLQYVGRVHQILGTLADLDFWPGCAGAGRVGIAPLPESSRHLGFLLSAIGTARQIGNGAPTPQLAPETRG